MLNWKSCDVTPGLALAHVFTYMADSLLALVLVHCPNGRLTRLWSSGHNQSSVAEGLSSIRAGKCTRTSFEIRVEFESDDFDSIRFESDGLIRNFRISHTCRRTTNHAHVFNKKNFNCCTVVIEIYFMFMILCLCIARAYTFASNV